MATYNQQSEFITTAEALARFEASGESVGAYDNLRQQCQSPAEVELLRILQKGYPLSKVRAQVRIGRYRLDFVTSDGVGWEVDGRNFHDADKDRERDEWLLQTGKLQSIIRLPAAAAWYYWDACMAVFELWSQYKPKSPSTVLSAAQVREEWEFAQDERDESLLTWLQWASDASAYAASEFAADVGKPLAFVDGWQSEFSKVDAYRLSLRLHILRRTAKHCC